MTSPIWGVTISDGSVYPFFVCDGLSLWGYFLGPQPEDRKSPQRPAVIALWLSTFFWPSWLGVSQGKSSLSPKHVQNMFLFRSQMGTQLPVAVTPQSNADHQRRDERRREAEYRGHIGATSPPLCGWRRLASALTNCRMTRREDRQQNDVMQNLL